MSFIVRCSVRGFSFLTDNRSKSPKVILAAAGVNFALFASVKPISGTGVSRRIAMSLAPQLTRTTFKHRARLGCSYIAIGTSAQDVQPIIYLTSAGARIFCRSRDAGNQEADA